MNKRIGILPILAFLSAGSAASPQVDLARRPDQHGSHVVPLQVVSKLATDKRFEIVSGDPATPGAPFVIRIHAEAGYVIMPHTHEVDENIVVLKGSWALGMGTHFNRDALEPMEVGDYGFAAGNMVHFAWSKTATIIQVHGIGPFATRWLVPLYELTGQGVLLKTSASDPGRPVPAEPAGCFAWKAGDRVQGVEGRGVILGAQCTPGQLTQYRVEKPDGTLFWAQRDELKTP